MKIFLNPPLEKGEADRGIRLVLLLIGMVLCPIAFADQLVHTQAEYVAVAKDLQPGDTIVLADGEWRDFEVLFTGTGQAGKPITLTAQTKGKVILTGQSNLRLAGEHLVVSGLVFKDGYTPTNEVISFRRNKDHLANHSRVTEVVIDHFNNPERFETDFWVMLYGKNNRFDHNHLEGKSNKGVTMAVRLNTEASRENHHRIDHNYFGPRPILGSNGGETLRIGTSHYADTDSLTRVEQNYFDRCDGEVEIISSKSGRNIFRGNVFHESRGTLTLRHGDGNLVEENVFFGNGKPHTGGIRVINRKQTVRNNYLQGLTGYRFGSALTVMNGVPNSPANRYVQVEDALIENNTIIDSEHIQLAAGSDAERSATPISTTFRNNLIHNSTGTDGITVFDDISGIEFSGNILRDVAKPTIAEGFSTRSVQLTAAANGLLYPVDASLAGVGAKRGIAVLDKNQSGVSWYPKPGADGPFDTGRSVAVSDSDGLVDAVNQAGPGDTIVLRPGPYRIRKLLLIDKPLTIRSGAPANQQSSVNVEFERSALFEIVDGGSLKLVGLRLSGKQAPDAAGNSVIRTSRYSMLNNYQLVVEQCEIADLDINHSFNFFSVAKHTFADAITITDSVFSNITGHVLQLDREVDDLGIYNVEYVTITGSRFENIGGTVANIYRGGTDESTFGPQLTLRASTLDAVGSNKRNKTKASLRLHGVQVTNIDGDRFVGSLPVRVIQTVGDPVARIAGNEFVDSAKPEVAQFKASECDAPPAAESNKRGGQRTGRG